MCRSELMREDERSDPVESRIRDPRSKVSLTNFGGHDACPRATQMGAAVCRRLGHAFALRERLNAATLLGTPGA
jgi:hypothetical protein